MFRSSQIQTSCWEKVVTRLLLITKFGLILLIMAPGSAAQYQLKKPGGSQSEASITVTGPSGDTSWEKGMRYEITWTSTGVRGSVKIALVDQQGKAVSLTRMTRNSGKYAFTLKRSISNGSYRVQVSTTDGKTIGESAGLISVVSKAAPGGSVPKPGIGGTRTSTPTRNLQPKTTSPTSPTTRSVQPTEPAQSPGVSMSPSSGRTPGQLSGIETVRREITAVQATAAQIALVDEAVSAGDLQSLPGVGNLRPTHMGGVVNVTSPTHDAEWLAGSQYLIEWTSADLTGNVKIDLVRVPSPTVEEIYPLVASTENDGVFDYLVPNRMGCKPWWFHVRVASADGATEDFSPNLSIYTEPVDMTCKIMDMRQIERRGNYFFYVERDEWLEFDVWLRNNGTLPSVTVQTVSIVLVKEPEEIVVAQEEWGFGSIYPRLWYKTPEPRRFDIESYWGDVLLRGDKEVNIEAGAYRVEVTVDPFDRLGEDPALTADNKKVVRFDIR